MAQIRAKVIVAMALLLFLVYENATSQRIWAGGSTSIAGITDYLIEECADTMINDTLWTEFIQRYAYVDSAWSEYPVLVYEHDGKVIAYDANISPEKYLLYDFSLNLLDTFVWGGGYFEVVEVDSVAVFGSLHKRLKLSHTTLFYEDVWVESIGSVKHHFFSPCEDPTWVDAGSTVSCFKPSPSSDVYHFIDSQFCFINQVEPVCEEYSSAIEILSRYDILIFPNPAENELFIEGHEIIRRYEIYSMNGVRIVSDKNNSNEFALSLSIQNLIPGIYYVRIIGDTGNQIAQFVKY